CAIGIKNIRIAEASAGNFVFLLFVLHGKSHKQIAIKLLDIKRRESRRNRRVGKSARRNESWCEVGVKYINGSVVEIGNVKEIRAVGLSYRGALIDRFSWAGKLNHCSWTRGPPGNGPILSHKDETRSTE